MNSRASAWYIYDNILLDSLEYLAPALYGTRDAVGGARSVQDYFGSRLLAKLKWGVDGTRDCLRYSPEKISNVDT